MLLCFIFPIFLLSKIDPAIEAEVDFAPHAIHQVDSVFPCEDGHALWAFCAFVQGILEHSLLCVCVAALELSVILDCSEFSVRCEEATLSSRFVEMPVGVFWIANCKADPAEACMAVSTVHLAAPTDTLDWLFAARASLGALHDVEPGANDN